MTKGFVTMAKAAKKTETSMVMEIKSLARSHIGVRVIGMTPLIYHAVAMKAMGALLLPSGPMNAAAKAENIKHDPIMEYRDSVYKWDIESVKTRLMVPAVFFKSAMMSAALRIPGATKASIAQLVWVLGTDDFEQPDKIAIYGRPKLRMDVVRLSGITNAPDIRTRAILPTWCAEFSISFATPLLTTAAVGNLLATAGMICGIGDYRQEKGKGSFGQFDINPPQARWDAIVKLDKAVQDAALEAPECFDDQTEILLKWFNEEIIRRGREEAITRVSEETGIPPNDEYPDEDMPPPPRPNGRGRRASP
jgi:hypothetical protein